MLRTCQEQAVGVCMERNERLLHTHLPSTMCCMPPWPWPYIVQTQQIPPPPPPHTYTTAATHSGGKGGREGAAIALREDGGVVELRKDRGIDKNM